MACHIDMEKLNAALPDCEDLRIVLGSIATAPFTSTDLDEVIGAPASISENHERDYPELRLYGRRSGAYSLPRVSASLAGLLATAGHDAPKVSACIVLSAYPYCRTRTDDPIGTLKRLVASLTEFDVAQYFVSCIDCGLTTEQSFSGFTVGPTPLLELEHRSRRAGSDYFERHGPLLKGRLCVYREATKVHAVPLHRLGPADLVTLDASGTALFYSLTDRYFCEIARARFDSFWKEFSASQGLAVALGAPYLDRRVLTAFDLIGSGVSIFNGAERRCGWVAPSGLALSVNISPKEMARFGMLPDGVTTDAMATTLRTRIEAYGRMLIRANQHDMGQCADDAFLHRVIALDTLLGQVDGTAEAVAARGSLLLAARLGTLPERHGLLKSLYNARSRYVHGGQPCDPHLHERLKVVCAHIGESLARLAASPRLRELKSAEHWHQMLDAAAATLRAGMRLAPGELDRIGVAEENSAPGRR